MAYNETPTDWIAMFLKNREIRIKVAKTPRSEDASTPMDGRFNIDPEKIKEISQEIVKYTSIAVIAVIATAKILDTLGDIAVKKTKSADEE
jgi:hypothetical protein